MITSNSLVSDLSSDHRALHANIFADHTRRCTYNLIFDFYNYDCDTIVHHYNVCFAALLDKYAPVKSINVPNGDPNPV